MQCSGHCAGEEYDVSFLCQTPHLDIEGTREIDTSDRERFSEFETIGRQWCFNFLGWGVSGNFAGQAVV
jgi:hypothetical protein